MCWATKKKKNSKPKVSDGNVKCRKLCFKRTSGDDDGIISWYEGFRYDVGSTYRTEMQCPDKLSGLGECYTIREGFHSYEENCLLSLTENKHDMLKRIDFTYEGRISWTTWAYPDRMPVILECHIPEGSTYYENEWGEMVSESITVDSIATIEGTKENE